MILFLLFVNANHAQMQAMLRQQKFAIITISVLLMPLIVHHLYIYVLNVLMKFIENTQT